MDKYNIALIKNEDGSVDLRATMADLRKKMGGLSESEQAAAASAIFGKNSMAGWLAIINASDKDFDKLTGAIDNCDGTALEMAETMQDNLMGQITILKSQLQELAIAFGDALMPMIRKVVSALQGFVDRLNSMSEGQRNAIIRIGMFVAALGPMLVIIGNSDIEGRHRYPGIHETRSGVYESIRSCEQSRGNDGDTRKGIQFPDISRRACHRGGSSPCRGIHTPLEDEREVPKQHDRCLEQHQKHHRKVRDRPEREAWCPRYRFLEDSRTYEKSLGRLL
jgi:hypothetical protein